MAATNPTLRASFPAKASVTNATDAARQVLLRLALAPSQSTNRCFSGQTITGGYLGVPGEYTNFFVNLTQQTGHTSAVMQVTYEVPPTNVQAAEPVRCDERLVIAAIEHALLQPRAPRVAPGEQPVARRRANRRPAMRICERHPLGRGPSAAS